MANNIILAEEKSFPGKMISEGVLTVLSYSVWQVYQ